jgi:hypothetical protein
MKNSLFVLAMALAFGRATGQCNELFISEYVEGSHNNKALEIYNPSNQTIDLSKYRLTRWQNGSAVWTRQYSDLLSGSIGPNEVKVTVLDRRDTTKSGQDTAVFLSLRLKADLFLSPIYDTSYSMSFNGDDALSLDKLDNATKTWLPVDIFGKIGQRPQLTGQTRTIGWSDSSPFYTGLGMWWTINHTMIRKASVKQGIKSNPAFFNPKIEWTIQPENMFDSLRTHNCACNKFPAKIENAQSFNLNLFPNPAENRLSAFVQGDVKQVIVSDVSGRQTILQVQTVKQNGFAIIQIDINNLSPGLYLISTTDQLGRSYTGRFVKQ